MNIIERVKNIILKPKDEWAVIDQETTSIQELFTNYLLLLALIPAIAVLIGFGFLHGGVFLLYGIKYAIFYYILLVASVAISAFIIDLLAQSFGAVKDTRKAMQLVIYSFTPALVAGIFYIIPALGFLAGLAGLYGLYILYMGLIPMMKTPEDKAIGYLVISILVIMVTFAVLFYILKVIIFIGAVAGVGMNI
jgi:hypothetical protein